MAGRALETLLVTEAEMHRRADALEARTAGMNDAEARRLPEYRAWRSAHLRWRKAARIDG